MDSVEAMQPIAPDVSGVIETGTDTDMDADLGAVWDRMERDNGAERGEGNRFVSPNAAEEPTEGSTGEPVAEEQASLEGGEGEGKAAEISTPAVDVPLPANMLGLEETWGKIPAELRAPIAAHMEKLHSKSSELGRTVSEFRPIGEALMEFKEYFDGTKGQYKPADAVKFLFGLQRGMDERPLETVLEIADRYHLRPVLAKALGQQAAQVGADGQPVAQQNDYTTALLSEIGALKKTLADMAANASPDRLNSAIEQKLKQTRTEEQTMDVISRTSKEMPLFDEVSEPDMVHFINRSWEKLGSTASQEAVLKSAYDMAVNADPDLRKKAAAIANAAAVNPKQVADAKRANDANIRSTSTGKTRELTDDELLSAVYDKHKGR